MPNVTACGFPIETHVTSHVSPPERTSPATTASRPPRSLKAADAFFPAEEGRVVGTRAGARIGGPMSTRIVPSARTSGRTIPAPVATAAVELGVGGEPPEGTAPLPFLPPSTSATNRARHRIPLPHISGSEPSLL